MSLAARRISNSIWSHWFGVLISQGSISHSERGCSPSRKWRAQELPCCWFGVKIHLEQQRQQCVLHSLPQIALTVRGRRLILCLTSYHATVLYDPLSYSHGYRHWQVSQLSANLWRSWFFQKLLRLLSQQLRGIYGITDIWRPWGEAERENICWLLQGVE